VVTSVSQFVAAEGPGPIADHA